MVLKTLIRQTKRIPTIKFRKGGNQQNSLGNHQEPIAAASAAPSSATVSNLPRNPEHSDQSFNLWVTFNDLKFLWKKQ